MKKLIILLVILCLIPGIALCSNSNKASYDEAWENDNLGYARLFNESNNRGYWFNYVVISDEIIYTDPITDLEYNTQDVQLRQSHLGFILDSETHFYYPPYDLVVGIGEAPNWLYTALPLLEFIKYDQTNVVDRIKGTESHVSSYKLANNASEVSLNLGRVRLYDVNANRGYWFSYTKLISGHILFIDPKTDRVYLYEDAINRRCHDDLSINYVTYYHYYPFVYHMGTCTAPEWLYTAYGR